MLKEAARTWLLRQKLQLTEHARLACTAWKPLFITSLYSVSKLFQNKEQSHCTYTRMQPTSLHNCCWPLQHSHCPGRILGVLICWLRLKDSPHSHSIHMAGRLAAVFAG